MPTTTAEAAFNNSASQVSRKAKTPPEKFRAPRRRAVQHAVCIQLLQIRHICINTRRKNAAVRSVLQRSVRQHVVRPSPAFVCAVAHGIAPVPLVDEWLDDVRPNPWAGVG